MAERSEETRARIIAVPEEIAACADEVAELAERVAPSSQLGGRRCGSGRRAGTRRGARRARLAELNA